MYVEELKNEKEWETFLQASPEGTFYHSLKWREVIQKSFLHSAAYLTIKDEDGTIVGICPGFILNLTNVKIYESTPCSDYGGPVIAKNQIEQASLTLRSFLQKYCSDKGIVYARICFTNDKLAQHFELPLGYVSTMKGVVEIDLKAKSSDCVWNEIFSKYRRRDFRRFERDNFQTREARTKSDLKDFYGLYIQNMEYIGASPYPYKFMENMWSILYPDNLRIWLVEQKKTIGGAAVFKYGRRTYGVYAGMDREKCRGHPIMPYLIWKEIKAAEEEGYSYMSLGGTPSDPNSPSYLQKISFGGLFHQQKMVWYPIGSIGSILLQTRAKTISAWKAVRNFLPTDIRRVIEGKLSSF
jgi:predicted N-acyltransferase